jgi:hypothetical protein
LLFLTILSTAGAQEKSVKPGISDPFKNPDGEKFQKTFEGESREVYVQREKIVAACEVTQKGVHKPGKDPFGLFPSRMRSRHGSHRRSVAARVSA